GGLCSMISMVAAPGHISHVGALPMIAFGERNHRRSARVERLQNAFSLTEGVQAEIPEDIHIAMWNKFLLIAPWSGVGAVTRAPIGVIRTLPETRNLLEHAMEEIHGLAHARNVAVEREAIRRAMAFLDTLPDEATASMQRDILAGRRSELDAQNGAVVRLGKEAAVATPVNGMIYSSLLPQEMQAGKRRTFHAG
ncbi:MAG: panE1, partial [Deltaproteobacteria bacterium]|nr:panE1 [Deltaproteobacteria bacterium]